MGLMDELKANLGKLDASLVGHLDKLEELTGPMLEKVKGEVHTFVNDPRFGGLHGLLADLEKNGLGPTVQSWVGKGENLPVTPEAIVNAIGTERIHAVADRLGIPRERVAELLAKVMPQVVDHLTPDGTVPPAPAAGAPAAPPAPAPGAGPTS